MLGCRLRRLGYRRATWAADIGRGVVTIPATMFAGLLRSVALAVWAVLLGLSVWIAWRWLALLG
ncbi:MAG: hypothetical protein F4204_08910 [Rhodospirillaceae bacterium]|nr:hypothetical protein [Rhodospirillaceae bacterium]MYG52453.1 hypothetical protein [Rhodospirillaceae bacterium]MYH38821.1 hypothetical protein [Rhodospirillaceae bacterium]MYK15979.1 hypothetical protein [Rhodospirillaceae bacterium]MYK58806.1 hypothetical protein [Rhodospirillaceae bacterium]